MQSLAERALCVIESRLKSIRTEDGYNTGAGEHVFRARRDIAVKDCPAAVLWDIGEAVTDSSSTRDVLDIEIHIELHVPVNQDDTGENLEAAKADTKRAVRPKGDKGNLKDSNGAIGALRYNGAQCFAREKGAATESITLKYFVTLTEVVGDPSSNGF